MIVLHNQPSLRAVAAGLANRIARKLTVFLSVALVLVTFGCARPSPSVGDIVGVWTNTSGTKFIFDMDGHFSVQALPRQFASIVPRPPVEREVNISGAGRWSLTSPPNESAWISGANWWNVQLVFDPLSSGLGTFETTVMFTRDGGRPTLFFWWGEEGGSRFELVKSAPALP